MVEIASTDDPVRLSFLRSVLAEAKISSFVFEAHAAGLWPGAVPARLMVAERDLAAAQKAICAADPRELWR